MLRVYSLIVVGLVAALLGGLGYMMLRGPSEAGFAQCRESAIAGGSGAIGGPFELVDHRGQTVTEESLLTRPTLIYFGYAFCPDVCPLDANRNAQATDLLSERGLDLQPVFISVDPRRDTPEVLAEFAHFMHPEMVALTGTEAQIREAARAYRAYYAIHDQDDDEFYLIDHSTFSYLLLPGHGFVEVFRRDLTPEALADRIACFIEAA
ncbi:MAG: SCO family protein [Rhodobacteraceae bacterium]|nr:SCO family protein [Paracoccaceae bacterium]